MDETRGQMRNLLSADTLMNEQVVNTAGEGIGKIEDYMIDLQSGCIAYAVLSFGGFMGIGDKLFAIPWNSIQVDQRAERFIVDVSKERLDNAPGFDKNNWPDWTPTYTSTLDDFWGVNQMAGAGTTGMRGGSMGGPY